MTGSANGFLGNSPYSITVEEVTPETAQGWLDNLFVRQRNLMPQHTLKIEQGISMGRFFPHSMICLALLNGRTILLDGQHRLEAIVRHGQPVSTPVGRYQARTETEIENWYSDIDQGAKRSARDAIRAHDLLPELAIREKYLTSFSSAVRLIGQNFFEPAYGGGGTTRELRARASSNASTVVLMRDWGETAKLYYEMIENGSSAVASIFMRASIAACALITLRFAPERATEFWQTITKDDGLKQGDPRKAFLDLMSRSGQGIQAVRNRHFPDVIRSFGAAWQAYCEGRELMYIRPVIDIRIKHVNLSDVGQSVIACLGVTEIKAEEVPTERANRRPRRRVGRGTVGRALFGGPQPQKETA